MNDRLTVDTITSDQLDALQDERDRLRQVLHLLRYGMARAKGHQLAAAYVVEVIDSTTKMLTGRAVEPCDRDQQYARAEQAETELRVLRAGLRANGADPTQIQNLWAQIRLRNRQWREEKRRAEALERAMESTAADALAHRGCHRDLMAQCLRAEQADAVTAETKRLLERRTTTLRKRAERAEAAIARVRLIKKAPSRSPHNLHANAQDDGWDQALDAVHNALGAPECCTTKSAGKDHPVHELLAALKSGLPHPEPVGLIGRYYDSIHEVCCPYDHAEPRPGYAAAANRAALDEIRHAPAQVVHPEPNAQVSEPHEVDEEPGFVDKDGEPLCTCTYGERCPNCRD